ncbi:MAG TPA: stage II sporulation protein M, partial [Spirochaetota bacterium]
MGESLKHFLTRKAIREDSNPVKSGKIRTRSELFSFWRLLDGFSSDIAFIRSRFSAHEEFFPLYIRFRTFIRVYFKTHLRDENIDLFTDQTGHLRIRKGSALRHFFSARLALHHQTVIDTLPYFLITLSLFITASAAGYAVVSHFSHYGEFFIPEEIQENLSRGILWTNILSDNPVAGGSQIILNNIVVSMKTFGFGVIFGLPSTALVLFNGWNLGSIMSATHQFRMSASLTQFVLNHGVMEISVILFSGALGLRLGLSFFAMPKGSRLAFFSSRFWESLNSMVIFCLWLFVCGIIESQVSPRMANTKPHIVMIPVAALIGTSVVLLYIF